MLKIKYVTIKKNEGNNSKTKNSKNKNNSKNKIMLESIVRRTYFF